MEKELIYLACPYSHPSEEIREERYEQVTVVLANMLEAGDNVFSPITMSHPVVKYLSSPDVIPHEQWLNFDFSYIDVSKEIRVLMLDGWEESKGVLAEIEYGLKNNIPIRYIDPNDYLSQTMIPNVDTW